MVGRRYYGHVAESRSPSMQLTSGSEGEARQWTPAGD